MTLTRTSTLKRTPMARKPPAEPKRRTRKCAVKSCRQPFEPRSMTHKACSPDCAAALVQMEKARTVKRERQEGLAKLKRRADHLKDAQKALNAYVRSRDAALPCICCGEFPQGESFTGGAWDAGHYRSVGSAPHLRFNEDNVHRQRKHCNRDGAGRAVDYRIGLIARIGLARVEALEADQEPRKYTIPELQQITATYRAKLRELKKGDA